MGVSSATGVDKASNVMTGSISAAGFTTSTEFYRRFNVAVWGTFNGNVGLQRSFDGGSTWFVTLDHPLAESCPVSFTADEPEPGVLYRLVASSFVSGTAYYRISQ